MTKTKKEHIIVYCGDDKSYFQTLQQRYAQTYSHLGITLVKVFSNDEDSYLSLFVDIIEIAPVIVYIDFSFNTKSFLKLSRQLKRISTFDQVPVVGLIDGKDHLKECWASGVNFTHLKGGEVHDVVYHPMFEAMPDKVKKPTFARGKFKKPLSVDLINDFRIGYITPDSIHAEGNFPQKKGDVVELTSALDKKLIPSKHFTVSETDNNDLYYDFDYSYDLSFKFIDDPDGNEDAKAKAMAMEDPKAKANLIKQLKAAEKSRAEDHKDLLRICKKKHKAWVVDKLTFSKPKKTKILIIDKDMGFLKNVKGSLDSKPFTIRLQTELTEDIRSLRRIFPHIIALNFVNKDFLDSMQNPNLTEIEKQALTEQLQELETSALNQVGRLVKRIRATEGYTPFVIIFNCENYTSKSLQDTYEYPLIISHTGNMDLEYILKMAELFEKKQEEKYTKKVEQKILALRKEDPKKYGRLTRDDFEEKRYYVSKNDELSFVSTKLRIDVLSISESDMTIATEQELSLGTYRLEIPFNCSISLVPVDGKNFQKDGTRLLYKAFIHSIDELDKKEVRRYVNETFFEDLNEKRDKEKDQFKKLHQSKLDQISLDKEKSDDEVLDDQNETD
ncbi:hypothetical protein A9Q84_07015 [Halobacteriovorax marinus]|uniref:Uncharacterized protein n=1 Tax=Halobacteriovorax marinus TaxID=97084 RepID=A0A1Y5F9T3_9BACT|nr:hypothetical protein A9Q84_07015 [Halobacteriovorax marinus]